MKRKKRLLITIVFLLAVTTILGGAVFVYGTASTKIPSAYVISNGTDYYHMDYNTLLGSYIEYRFNPQSSKAALAKFYFDTLGPNVDKRFSAYVSGVTEKFVSYQAVIRKYLDTFSADQTYKWFNSKSATPAFSKVTRVWTLDENAKTTGRYYVDTDGYIIKRSTYEMDATALKDVFLNVPAEFNVSVTSNDRGIETLTGSIYYEITGGSCTLEIKGKGGWTQLTDGKFDPPESITPDWTADKSLRFTAHQAGDYKLKFMLKTTGGEVLAQKELSVTVTGSGMQLDVDAPRFRAGTTGQIDITTIANNDSGRRVRAHFTIPSGASVEYYDSTTGDWKSLPEVFGPEEGFPVEDGTLSLRAVFTESGVQTIKVKYIEVGTNLVLAEKDIQAAVEQPLAFAMEFPELTMGQPEAFTLTTQANDDAGKKVRIYFTVPDDITLEYQDPDTGDWVEITDAYGPTTGFALEDAVHTFRATASGFGMKPVSVKFIEVGTDMVLAEQQFTAIVDRGVQPTITIPGIALLRLPADTAQASLDVGNPAGNDCSFVIKLLLSDDTVLFTSDKLAPGEIIGDVALTRPLAQGEYNAKLIFEAYDQDDSALNTAEETVKLIVH